MYKCFNSEIFSFIIIHYIKNSENCFVFYIANIAKANYQH